MKKEFLAIAIFLIISNIAVAQQPGLGSVGGSSGGGMMRHPIPNAPRANLKPPFLKGDQTLAETWSSTIAAFGNNPDGMTVNCFAEDSDNLYIGGDFGAFDTVVADFIVQYNRKTGVWSSLERGLNNDVYSLAVHNDTLYAAGAFSEWGLNDSINYIAMWDGSEWHNLRGGMDNVVNSIAFIGDTLYAGGNFGIAGGIDAEHLAYWDGQNWYQAAGGVSAPVSSLFATHDSLFVGGGFHSVYLPSKTPIVANGTAMLQNGNWTTFGSGYYASAIALFNGQLWVGGQYFSLPDNSLTVNQIAYWDGSNWNAISSDTMVGIENGGEVNQFYVTGDTLLVLGGFNSMAGVSVSGVAMLLKGTWSNFAGGIYGFGNAAISFNGSLYIGGQFTKAGLIDAMAVASDSAGNWTPHARLVSSNAGWQSEEVRAIATTSRYVFIGGNFETIAGQVCNHVAAWDKQLKQWITLGSGVDGDVYSLAVQGNNLVVGGEFQMAGTIPARHLAECNITTKLWTAMGAGAYRSVDAIAVDTNGLIYAPIFNPLVGNVYYDYLGQWDGTKWNSYGNGLNSGFIEALAWQRQTLYAAGTFVQTDEALQVNYVAQLQDSVWGSLNSGLNSYAYALAPSSDSLYVSGVFTKADGQVDTALAVWNGSNWNPIASAGLNGGVYALAADGNGGVYAGGQFSEVAGVSRGNLVHWNGSAFGTVSSGVNNTVEALATDSGALYAGGWFTEAGSSAITSLHFGALSGAGVDAVSISSLPDVASLSIFPNPASASSTISVGLAKAGNIRIEIFNALGSRVALLADGTYQTGQQEFTMDASKMLSGIYFLRLTNDGVVTSENFVVERE
jgi:trimeric autotransporter adhesin